MNIEKLKAAAGMLAGISLADPTTRAMEVTIDRVADTIKGSYWNLDGTEGQFETTFPELQRELADLFAERTVGPRIIQ